MTTWSIVLAAGAGSRFGGPTPKQFELLGGMRVVDWSLQTARAATRGVVLVVPESAVGRDEPLADRVVAGGASRSESVRAGLAALPGDVDVVAVHDGARPMATVGLFARVIDAVVDGIDGAIPGLEVTDTLKRVDGDRVVATIDRHDLVSVQTPQAFRVDALRYAHRGEPDATDDAALVESAGGRVLVVDGERLNLKITGPSDLVLVQLLASQALGEFGPRGASE